MMYSYIAPFLLTVTSMSGQEVSGALFAFGIATLIGSKFGGFITDKIGNTKTLISVLVVHAMALVLLSTIARSTFVAIQITHALVILGMIIWPSTRMHFNKGTLLIRRLSSI